MRDFEPEEPVLTPGYLCDFTDLEVKAILLDEILKDPESIKADVMASMIVKYECKSLRDTWEHLASISLKDAIAFVEQNPHPWLWKLIVESALEKLDFDVATWGFVRLQDYYGLLLITKLRNMDDKQKQWAEIAIYYGWFDEAEQIYREIDRKDLALDMWWKLGDWSNVVELIEDGLGDDATLKDANNWIG